MHESPRIRRLRNDLLALERLQSESSVFRFKAQGNPPQLYRIHLKGKSLWRVRGQVRSHDSHHVEIKLGASYPRTMPEIRWITQIYHPNISEIGMVCLGGYGTYWVPSVQLDELCNMLWDMARYHNYDIRSPYNRDAALWVASQTTFLFPIDPRPLRDLRAAQGRIDPKSETDSGIRRGAALKNSPNGSPIEARPDVEDASSGSSRVRQFVARYGGIFTKSPERPARRSRDGNDETFARLSASEEVQPASDSVLQHQEVEEVILFEPQGSAEATCTTTDDADDGITFIE
jgi:ubiquitin-protein ligase